MVYWIRSLVPMLKKSTSFANWSASTAVDGISTMIPNWMWSDTAIFSAASFDFSSRRRALAWRNSSSVAIIGNMIRKEPNTLARSSARSWVRNMS
ncbi:hypothetical protein D3C76_1500860 [compost metagenome]